MRHETFMRWKKRRELLLATEEEDRLKQKLKALRFRDMRLALRDKQVARERAIVVERLSGPSGVPSVLMDPRLQDESGTYAAPQRRIVAADGDVVDEPSQVHPVAL